MNAHDAALPTHAVYVAQLYELFAGAQTHHGTYDHARIRSVDPGEKVEVKQAGIQTIHKPPTPELWGLHLAGYCPLGVCPLTADDSCVWGCIDVDDYELSHAELVSQIEQRGLPLVVCRSKSGGAHLYLFVSEPMPAADMLSALGGMREQLDLRKVDIFPARPSGGAENRSGWVNMPYFGGDESERYAFKRGGLAMTVAEFLKVAQGKRVTSSDVAVLRTSSAKSYAPQPGRLGGRRLTQAERKLSELCQQIEKAPAGEADKLLNKAVFEMGGWHRETSIERETVEAELRSAWRKRRKSPSDFAVVWPHAFDDGVQRYEFRAERDDRFPVFEKLVRVLGGDETEFEVHLAGCEPFLANARQMARYGDFLICCVRVGKMFNPMKHDEWAALVREALAGAEERRLSKAETVEGQFFRGARRILQRSARRGECRRRSDRPPGQD
ncbi:MAG TPA: hypothetical protein VGO17_14110 [Aurantimonas sp.]|jgi:hypothetical protein|nr:hypothetical protein [Aurantimonas sp.]